MKHSAPYVVLVYSEDFFTIMIYKCVFEFFPFAAQLFCNRSCLASKCFLPIDKIKSKAVFLTVSYRRHSTKKRFFHYCHHTRFIVSQILISIAREIFTHLILTINYNFYRSMRHIMFKKPQKRYRI